MAISDLTRLQPRVDDLPTVSVVICTYTEERWDDMVAALRSVEGQTVPAHEMIVVVDHNPALRDRLIALVDDVVVIDNQGRPGLSDARNTGIARAHGEVIAFLDDDAEADADWLHHLRMSYSNPHVLGVGGAAEPLWEDGRPAWFPAEFDWVVGCSYRGLPERLAPVRNLIGANMSIRRSALEAAGGFSPALGRVGANTAGCEETELCIRAVAAEPNGFFAYEPRARVRHRVPTRRGSWRYFRQRCFSEGRSKATVSRFAKGSKPLDAERAYTTRTLPSGVARHVRRGHIRRAVSIIGGLAITTAGYVRGRLGPGAHEVGPERR